MSPFQDEYEDQVRGGQQGGGQQGGGYGDQESGRN